MYSNDHHRLGCKGRGEILPGLSATPEPIRASDKKEISSTAHLILRASSAQFKPLEQAFRGSKMVQAVGDHSAALYEKKGSS